MTAETVLTEVIRKDSTRAENNRITSCQYDNQGNTLQEETRGYTESLLQTSRYEYDGFNKTRKVTVEYFGNETDLPTATQTQENFYDAENLRYGIAENGDRTNFITNGWKVVSEQDESYQTTNRIVLGYGIIASDSLKQEGDGYQYFHWNEHGDTEYITGEDGQVLNSYGYDAFGSLTTAEEIVRNRYTYNGKQYDAITSQYYLRVRFYNPQVARFTQEDVYRGDGLNLYAYCANNPVLYVDPSGYNGQKCPEPGEPEGQKKQTATEKRNSTGTVEGGINAKDLKKMMYGSDNNAGIIPKDIADKLKGKSYDNFDEFRKDFWKTVAETKYADEFIINGDLTNLYRMRNGGSPLVNDTQTLNGSITYQLHHKTPINQGGAVFNLDNILVVTPRYHAEILIPEYHGYNGFKKYFK